MRVTGLLSKLVLSTALSATVGFAHADANLDRIKKAVEGYAHGGVVVDEVNSTPISGLFQVVIAGEVIHVDATGRYVLVNGRMLDMAERRDLTAEVLDRIQRVSFEAMPKDLAIVTVRGSGRRKIAVFEDPSCPVCQQMQPVLDRLEDVTIYTYTYPVISPQSIPAAVATWCGPAASRDGQWTAYMRGAPLPAGIEPSCVGAGDTVKAIVDFGQSHGIQNTPTMVLGSGQRVVGAVSYEDLIAALDQ